MKRKIVNQLAITLFSGAMLIGLVGCIKDLNDGSTPLVGNGSSVFDFSTKSVYALNVKYNVPKGYKVYFEVYTENPLALDEKGQTIKKANLEAIDKGFTDENGKYSNRLVVPSYAQQVFIYSPNVGVNELLVAVIEGGVLKDATLPVRKEESLPEGISVRAGNISNETNYPNVTTKLLGEWENYVNGNAKFPNIDESILYFKQAKLWGRPNYLTYIDQSLYVAGIPAKRISAEIWNAINAVFPGVDLPQDELDVVDNGDIHVSEKATIDICFLDDRGIYMNVLGYYCYNTNNAPKSIADIKTQVIALPNAKLLKSYSNSFPGSAVLDYGALRPGEGVRLRYIDQDGTDHGEEFPAGVSIGWVLYANGYSRFTGSVGVGVGPIYSNPALLNGLAHAALFRHNDLVVLSFEDAMKTKVTDKRDYDDVLFSVASSPASAITPGVPDKNPAQPDDSSVATEVTYRGILLFEDIWPYRGDFDMNDVVVKYVSKVGYNSKNEVVQTKEEFTPMGSGASLNNSFSYQNPNLTVGATVVFEGGDGNSKVDSNDKSIIRLASHVRDYANLSAKKTFVVTTKYAVPIAKSAFVLPPYNPFITVDSKNSHEVHLTNMKPTSYADVSMLTKGHDRSDSNSGVYYVTYNENNEQMPFGIDVMFEDEAKMNAFVIPREEACINTYYAGFIKWLLSSGKTNQDWYLFPLK